MFKLYIKGADNAILERLDPAANDMKMVQETQTFLFNASSQGFRTLLVAVKVFDEAEVHKLMKALEDADSN